MILRGSGLIYNLEYDDALARYGLWTCKITKTCSVHGKVLQPGDTAELTGEIVQLLVSTGCAAVTIHAWLKKLRLLIKRRLLDCLKRFASWRRLRCRKKIDGQ